MVNRNRIHTQFVTLTIHAILIMGAVFMLFPFIWIILGSLKTYNDVTTSGFFPRQWVWSNYSDAITMINGAVPCRFDPSHPLLILNQCVALRWFANSIFVGIIVVCCVLITSVLAAYAFARLNFPGRDILFVLLLTTMMIPSELTLIPNFILMVKFPTLGTLIQAVFHLSPSVSPHNWIDTYYALVIPWTASAFSIFLLRQSFRVIPHELFDAAVLDGASHLQFLWQIILPISKPVLISSALLTFLGSWNALMWPLLVTNSPLMRPVQAGLAQFISDAGMQVQWLLAAATMTIIPIMFAYLALQRWFVEGITSTGIRG